jgi:hypothetical protein
MNYSEHVYPLVAALDAVGMRGMPYSEALPKYGTMLERTLAAEAERDRLREALKQIAKLAANRAAMMLLGPRAFAQAERIALDALDAAKGEP